MKRAFKSPVVPQTPSSLREHNVRRALGALRRSGAATTRSLALELGLSMPTAASLLRTLEGEGFARQDGHAPSSGGRLARRYHFVPGARAVVLVDLGSEAKLRVSVLDLAARPLREAERPIAPSATHSDIARLVVKTVSDLLQWEPVAPERVLGTVVSVPGVDVEGRGLIVNSTNRLLEGMPFTRLTRDALPSPLLIVNDANLAAVGAAVAEGKEDLVFVYLGEGLGMGIYLDNEIREGAFGFAGEVGHIPLGDPGISCYCGQRGCLERLLSLRGMAEQFTGKAPGGADAADQAAFLDAVARSDARALRVLSRASEAMSDLAIVIANLLDPDIIAVGSTAPAVLPWLQRALEQALHSQVLQSHARPTVVQTVDLAVVMPTGAVELALRAQPAGSATPAKGVGIEHQGSS